ncbi:MAG: hypothetical protein RLZZ488_70 [Pseudomonadota bacterium]
MKNCILFLSLLALASACHKNLKQLESDSSSRNDGAALPIKGSFVAKDIYTSALYRPLIPKAVHLSGDKIDKDTTGLIVDLSESGEGSLTGHSRCKELGLMTLNIGSQFVSELILETEGFKAGVSPFAKASDVSRCGGDYGAALAESVRKVYPAKNVRGEALRKLPLDMPIPAYSGVIPGMPSTVNGECSKLFNGKMLRVSVANDNNTQPHELHLEPLACLGFKDRDMKKLRMILVHQTSGVTMIDYEMKDEAK